MKTEAEAKKCWCPFARMLFLPSKTHEQAVGYNRIQDATGPWDAMACIASECMAWRWGDIANSDGDVWRNGILQGKIPRIGFCGLSGKP